MRRVTAGAVAALLLLVSLTGCRLLFHQDDVAEEPLREQLDDLPTVVRVSSEVDPRFDSSFIWVTVSDLVESDLQAIVARADELLTGREVSLKIQVDDQVYLHLAYPFGFSADELVTEVHYWFALSEANQAPLGILLEDNRYGPARNIWEPDESIVIDWDALRAVPDPSTVYHSYYLDDIVARVAMPTPEVLALRDRLAVVELGDDESVALEVFAPGYVEVRYVAPGGGRSDPTTLTSWLRIQEVVSYVAALGLPQANFVLHDTGTFAETASLHLGACDEVSADSQDEASTQLVDALTAAGSEFPLGISSGFCDDQYA